jgi:hypothetical protein
LRNVGVNAPAFPRDIDQGVEQVLFDSAAEHPATEHDSVGRQNISRQMEECPTADAVVAETIRNRDDQQSAGGHGVGHGVHRRTIGSGLKLIRSLREFEQPSLLSGARQSHLRLYGKAP